MVFIIRFSIVPSHFSTAVFSTCDVKFWHFCVATFLTLPKQIFIVYLGVLLVAQDENNKTQTIVLVITFAITVVMGYYIWVKMKTFDRWTNWNLDVFLITHRDHELANVTPTSDM